MKTAPAEATPRWPLPLALLVVGAVTAPLMVGRGIDMPDDFLYYDVAGWEWLRHAWQQGKSPWFVPGKMGGVNLFGDVIAMAPFYPACWLARILPVFIALPLAWMLHTLGAVLTMRWCGRRFGLSRLSATLAGVAVMVGPIGMMAIIDGRTSGRPLWLWLPVVLGAIEGLCAASSRKKRLSWAVVAGLGLALILLGTHIRVSAAVCASVGLWIIIRRAPLAYGLLIMILALCGGAPGFIPMLLEWQQSAAELSRLQALATPSEALLGLWSLPGLISPVVDGFWENYGMGVVLLAGLVLALSRLRGPVGRLALLSAVLILAVLSLHLPGLRYLFAPLLLLTHPVNTIYFGLGIFFLILAAGAALDRLLCAEVRPADPWSRRVAPALLGALVVLALLQAVLGHSLFADPRIRISHGVGVVQAVVVLLALWALLRGGRPLATRRRQLIFLLAVAELTLTAVRFHITIPSEPLKLLGRTDIHGGDEQEGVEDLAEGFLDVTELMDMEGFIYQASIMKHRKTGVRDPEARRDWAAAVSDLQRNELDRVWPVHLGLARGFRAVAGRAKMPPARVIALLDPLIRALKSADPAQGLLEAPLWGPQQMGGKIMSLFGVPVAVEQDDIHHLRTVTTWCYSVAATRLVPDQGARVRQLLRSSFIPQRSAALVESALEPGAPLVRARVRCDHEGAVEVSAAGRSLVVVRERFHPGWEVQSQGGERLPTFPVNQIHMGVLLPAGNHTLGLRFNPPGLALSQVLAAAAWAVGLVILGAAWFRRRP